MPSISKHRNRVGDLEDLFHTMGDVNHCGAPSLKPTDKIEQMLGLIDRKRTRWLVKNDDIRVNPHCGRDLHHLFLTRCQLGYQGMDINVYPDLAHEGLSAFAQLAAFNETAIRRHSPKLKILRNT